MRIPRRTARHGAAVTALAAVAVLSTGATGHASTADRPDTFGGESAASAFHFFADRTPGFLVADLFHVELPYATSSFDSNGTISSRAAAAFPGDGALGVPGLVCFSAPVCDPRVPVPNYPLIAEASFPTTPNKSAQASGTRTGVGPATFDPEVVEAHALPAGVEALTTATGVSVPGMLTAGAVRTHSTQHFVKGALEVSAESSVTDLDLAGGALHLDGVSSVARGTVDGAGVHTTVVSTIVTGATVGGVPVVINETGIHAAGQSDNSSTAALNSAFAQLKAAGIGIRAIGTDRTNAVGAVSASTGGLLVSFAQTLPDLPPVPGAPGLPASAGGDYRGTVSIAGTGITGFAAPAAAVGDVPLPAVNLPGTTGHSLPPVTSAGARLGSAGTSGTPAIPGSPGTPTAPMVAGAPGGTPAPVIGGTRPVGVLGIDLTAKRLKRLSLLLLGYPVLVLLGSAFRAPARLPHAY
jgi:hypothetical protein